MGMKGIKHLPLYFGGLSVIALALGAPSASAQEVSKFFCQTVGGSDKPEPLGDREGHGITVTTASCRNLGGVLDGSLSGDLGMGRDERQNAFGERRLPQAWRHSNL